MTEVNAPAAWPNTLIPTRDALGDTPRMTTLHPAGSGWAGLTYLERSCLTVPCAAIDEASPNASAPEVGAFGPSPLKSR